LRSLGLGSGMEPAMGQVLAGEFWELEESPGFDGVTA
jgi:hypothetical protein